MLFRKRLPMKPHPMYYFHDFSAMPTVAGGVCSFAIVILLADRAYREAAHALKFESARGRGGGATYNC